MGDVADRPRALGFIKRQLSEGAQDALTLNMRLLLATDAVALGGIAYSAFPLILAIGLRMPAWC